MATFQWNVSMYLRRNSTLESTFSRYSSNQFIFPGLTCGLLYFPSLSIVAQWFESRRALAVGLAICGSGVGTSLMALCFSSAVNTFSWRGVLIIYGAIFFQLSVCLFNLFKYYSCHILVGCRETILEVDIFLP